MNRCLPKALPTLYHHSIYLSIADMNFTINISAAHAMLKISGSTNATVSSFCRKNRRRHNTPSAGHAVHSQRRRGRHPAIPPSGGSGAAVRRITPQNRRRSAEADNRATAGGGTCGSLCRRSPPSIPEWSRSSPPADRSTSPRRAANSIRW